MDGLFVKPARKGDTSSNGSGNAGARRMVQDMVDIVLDEDGVSLSPDEQRLRDAGKGGKVKKGKQDDDDSWAEALEAASSVYSEGYRDELEAPKGPKPIVDGLFAKRKAPSVEGPPEAAPKGLAQQNKAMADDLFTRKAPPVPPLGVINDLNQPGGNDAEEESDGEDEEGADGGGETKETSLCCRRFRCQCLPQGSCPCDRELPNRAIVAKFGGGTLLVVALLALVTVTLATGCDVDAPLEALGEYCVLEGPVQLVIAFLPVTLLSCTLYCWFRRSYKTKVNAKSATWQHDGEAQRSAAELLDTLTVAPAGERHKYAGQAVQVMRDFPDKAVIQYKGCAALEAICRAQRGNVQQVHAAGAVPTMLEALEKHLRVRKVQSAGLSALACLAKISKQQIFELGGIETVLKSMTKFKRDAGVIVSGSMALGALCLSSIQNRKSVARFGGVSILLQSLERHVERADVIIAASETLALIAQDSSGLQKQMLASLSVIQGIAERYDMAKSVAVKAGSGSTKAQKRIKDCEIVLRSLRKLEARLSELAEVDEDDAASDVATPRLDPTQEGGTVVQANNNQSSELMGRLGQWKKQTG